MSVLFNRYGIWYNPRPVEPEVLRLFYDRRDRIIGCLLENPALLSRNLEQDLNFDDNPILQLLDECDLCHFGSEAYSSFPIDSRRWTHSEREDYSLIQLALYLVFLLNIYEPNKALITNLYYTGVMVDALGHLNEISAENSIQKTVAKTLGYLPTSKIHTRNIIEFVKRDAELSGKVRSRNDGIEFERSCQSALETAGFSVQSTPRSGDYGADIITTKDGLSFAVQCKDMLKPVGVKAVQEAIGARAHYKADFAVVCASGGFTDAAVELATSNKVIICGLSQLARRLDLL